MEPHRNSVARLQSTPRLQSIDVLRGSVMVLMALDHVRDFFHSSAASFSPTDLSKTTPVLFFTRWITHFCLPVFMFAAGMGAFLWWRRGNRSRSQLSRFLWTRGLWFIVLELTVMQLAYDFNFSSSYLILMLILWIFGACMILMAALIYLPLRVLAIGSVAVIALHNCLDGISASRFGSAGWAWKLIHQPGVVVFAGRQVLVPYTLLPWIAVMAAGFCFGRLFLLESARRRRIMLRIGLLATLAFFVIRAINHYGDPAPWAVQKSALFTVLSFLNCTKYPGSLDFLLMTLGPAILVLALLDGCSLEAIASAGGLRTGADVLLRAAFLCHSYAGGSDGVGALRTGSLLIHVQSASVDGWAGKALSGKLWLRPVGGLPGVDGHRGVALSDLQVVRRGEGRAARLVAELSLVTVTNFACAIE